MNTMNINNNLSIKALVCVCLILMVSGCASTEGLSTTSSSVDAVTPDITLNHFVDTRLASIKKEAAIGHGENLNALADMMGKDDKVAFGAWMQLNYETLFTGLNKSGDLISRIENTLPTT